MHIFEAKRSYNVHIIVIIMDSNKIFFSRQHAEHSYCKVSLAFPNISITLIFLNQSPAVNVVKVSHGRRSQVADGHLGRAQVADAWRVSHIGLGSNFQPSLIWPTHILNYLYLKVQV